VSKVHPQPEIRTSQTQLLGTTTGLILTAVVAVVGLAVLIVPVFLAANPPDIRRLTTRRRREVIGSRSAPEISSGQGSRPWEQMEDRQVPPAGHLHGKPSSWLLVAMVVGAFTTGGIAIIVHAWWLFWACAGIAVLAIPAGKLIGIMDDTIAWGSTPTETHDPPHDQETRPRHDQSVPTQR
jgi:hypothetical protein